LTLKPVTVVSYYFERHSVTGFFSSIKQSPISPFIILKESTKMFEVKGIVSQNVEVLLPSHPERVHLILKLRFRIEFLSERSWHLIPGKILFYWFGFTYIINKSSG
jgi:hypothetical protein